MKPYRIFQALTSLTILEGILAVELYFSTPSKTENTLVAGYSTSRLLGGMGLVIVLAFFLALLGLSLIQEEKLKNRGNWFKQKLTSDIFRLIIAVPIFFALAIDLLALSIYFIPAAHWAFPFVRTYALIQVICERTYIAQIWMALILIKAIVFYALSASKNEPTGSQISGLAKSAIISWSLTICVLALSVIWGIISRDMRLQLTNGPALKLLAFSIWLSVWALAERKNSQHTWQHQLHFWIGTIWLAVFLSSFQLGHWLDTITTARESYWHLLADSFLHGRVYLLNPPSDQDLVYFNSHWYIPIPPLPAFVMLPLVAVWGIYGVNMTVVSLCISATTPVLIFLILDEMRKLSWIRLSLSGQLWLVALFSFGTVHLWLSIAARVWHLSQTCAVLFSALAFLTVLKKAPSWITGFCLGLAIMARPNLFTLWPALAAIAIQLQFVPNGKLDWKKSFGWAFFSALPVIAAVGFLLYYNYLRFGNFMDFGYTAISSGGTVVSDARQYGVFSLHFIPQNILTMFLSLPELDAQCGYFLPRGHGISMLAATPAVLYLFRRLKISWWTIGCWLTLILSMGLLATYHNDGSIQYAYRYIIDFIIPIIMLIALNTGTKVSWPLRILIMASMAMNYFGTISWFFSKC